MALLWIDGFEGYGVVTGSYVSSSILAARGYSDVSSYTYIAAGKMFGYSIRNNVAHDSLNKVIFTTPALTTDSTLIAGCAFMFFGNNTSSINFYDGATLGINAILRPTAPSTLTLNLGASTITTYSSFTMRYSEWYHLEMKVFCHPTSGTVEVRIDGVTVISLTGINTQTGAHAYHDKVSLTGAQFNYLDDFYVCDGSGTTVNNLQGVCKVVGLLPNADTDTIEWTPSSGSTHYNLVDSNPPNTSDYIFSSTQTNTDLYTYPDLIGTGTIIGFQLNTQAMLSDGTSIVLQTPVVSDGTTDLGPDYTLTSGTYTDFKHISTTNPHTGSVWTVDGLNAAQIGVRVM
ncbi:MAG: hypothetical protein PHT48_14080 [Dechloromonas sp.]|jgi:hypothetical protein|nr:hypothetical protein [Dechloromonas sp.]